MHNKCDSSDQQAVYTGDNYQLLFWLIMLVLSLSSMTFIVVSDRKKKRKVKKKDQNKGSFR